MTCLIIPVSSFLFKLSPHDRTLKKDFVGGLLDLVDLLPSVAALTELPFSTCHH